MKKPVKPYGWNGELGRYTDARGRMIKSGLGRLSSRARAQRKAWETRKKKKLQSREYLSDYLDRIYGEVEIDTHNPYTERYFNLLGGTLGEVLVHLKSKGVYITPGKFAYKKPSQLKQRYTEMQVVHLFQNPLHGETVCNITLQRESRTVPEWEEWAVEWENEGMHKLALNLSERTGYSLEQSHQAKQLLFFYPAEGGTSVIRRKTDNSKIFKKRGGASRERIQ